MLLFPHIVKCLVLSPRHAEVFQKIEHDTEKVTIVLLFITLKLQTTKLLLDIISSASLLHYLSMRSGNSICLKFWHIWKNLEIWVICNSAWPIWRNANSCPRELSHDMLARPFMIKFVIRIEQIIRSVWDYLLFFRVDFDGQIGI